MGPQRLADLLADSEYGIKRAHRLLKDHADALPGYAPHGALHTLLPWAWVALSENEKLAA
jgi:hypothetical protein